MGYEKPEGGKTITKKIGIKLKDKKYITTLNLNLAYSQFERHVKMCHPSILEIYNVIRFFI